MSPSRGEFIGPFCRVNSRIDPTLITSHNHKSMAIKPIDAGGSFLATARVVFLIGLAVLAVVISFIPKEEREKKVAYARSAQPDEQKTKEKEEEYDEKMEQFNEYKESLVTEAEKTYEDLTGEVERKSLEASGKVLGIAQKKVEETASESAEVVKTAVYKSTVGEVVRQLLESMPERARKELIEELYDETHASPEADLEEETDEEESGESEGLIEEEKEGSTS